MRFRRRADGHAENQRQVAPGRRRPGHAPPVGLARPARNERHQVRLRRRLVRRLHRAPGRHAEAILRDARERCGRTCDHDHRGHRRNASRQESPAGLARSRGHPVRLLSVRPSHGRRCVAGEDPGPDRYRYRPGDVGEHLPLRHLSAHPRGHQACSSEAVERGEGALNMGQMSRRHLLFAGAAAGGGLLIGWRSDAGARALAAADRTPPAAFAPNAFIRIGRDGRVTLIMCQVEMGQGTYTSMPMLMAEELEVGLDQVQLEHAPPDDKLYANPLFGDQETGGSSSVRSFYEPLRRAGATARTMLVAAAAQTWDVDPASCRAKRGVVTHTPSGRTLSYGALAEKAAKLPVPDKVPLKDPKDFTLIGTPAKRLDTPDKVNGKAQYGIDVRLPGMKIATVAASPVLGGKVAALDGAKAMAIPGVRQIVNLGDVVAVVADHMWAAKQGLAALAIRWDDGPNGSVSTADVVQGLDTASQQPGVVARTQGQVADALGGAAKKIDAVYQVPFLAHATLEPMNCTVHVQKDRCEVWTGSQTLTRAQGTAGRVTGLPLEKEIGRASCRER